MANFKYNKWCADYDNNKVLRYDEYIKKVSKEDQDKVSYFQGSFQAACKYYGIDGTDSLKVKSDKFFVLDSMFPEDNKVIADKRDRMFNKVVWYQNSDKTVLRTSAEIFDLLSKESREVKFYLDDSVRDRVIKQVIFFSHSMKVPFADRNFLYRAVENYSLRNTDIKRFIKLQSYYRNNKYKEYFCEIVPIKEIENIDIFA